ncbi:MAG: FecR domain-containing protein [Cereibacter changlensis]
MASADDEALEWLVRLNDTRLDEATERDFAQWLAQPGHAEEWRRAEAFWRRLQPATTEIRRRRHITRRAALATGAAALLLPGGFWLSRPGRFAEHRTAAGETRRLLLADGSRVDLAAGSALSTAFDPMQRALTLHVGEAFFLVAADPARPFVVTAGHSQVTALGTAFNIRLTTRGADVTVTEHAVLARSGSGEARVFAGQRLSYDAVGLHGTEPADAESATAWLRGVLVFEAAPLGEVMDVLARNAGWRVMISEAARRVPVTAIFNLAQLDQAPEILARTLPVRVTRAPGGIVILHAS